MKIAIINKSSASDAAIAGVADAMGVYLNQFVCNDYERQPVDVYVEDPATQPAEIVHPDIIPCYVFEQPGPTELGILAYHDSQKGCAFIRAFLSVIPNRELLRDPAGRGASLCGAMLHDAAETVIDTSARLYVDAKFSDPRTGASFGQVALEICDPVQDDAWSWPKNGLAYDMPNYVKPAWFLWDSPPSSFDHMGLLAAPLTMRPGGYLIARAEDGGEQVVDARRTSRIAHEVSAATWRAAHRAAGPGGRSTRRDYP